MTIDRRTMIRSSLAMGAVTGLIWGAEWLVLGRLRRAHWKTMIKAVDGDLTWKVGIFMLCIVTFDIQPAFSKLYFSSYNHHQPIFFILLNRS